MSNEIIYQINGQLADNTVTKDNLEDRILVPVSLGTADEARIIAEMKAEDSGLREETIQHVFDLRNRVEKRLLLSGLNINTGFYHAAVSFRGVIDGGTWNPEKNSIVVNFNPGADLRDAIGQTRVNIIGERGAAMYIDSTTDVSTRAQNATATPGRAFTVKGDKINIAGTDPSVGITLTSSAQVVTQVTQDLWVDNMPKKVTFIIPTGLADGAYELKLTTQSAGSGKALLKTPRSVVKTIYIGEAPAGGGGANPGGGADGDQDENPLG